MSAGKWSISHIQGDTFTFDCVIRDKETQVPWDLTGWSVKFTIKQFASATNNLLQLSTINNNITVDNIGNINIIGNASDMNSLPVGRLIYDIELTNTSGAKETILQGPFIVTAQVS